MLELPQEPINPLQLADWLELTAILSDDLNSSRGDLERALHRAALVEVNSDDAIERKMLEVFNELEQRVTGTAEAYPFDLTNEVISLKSDWEGYAVYTFCLFLSYFGSSDNKPRKLFEQISCAAAKRYLYGNAVGFGAPRTEISGGFANAVVDMCKLLGEGDGYRHQPSLRRKDDALDLFVWKDFQDKRPSKIILFGQCASGNDWENKLGELQPEAFLKQWLNTPLISPDPIKSFFVPHRIDRSKWELVSRKVGILFDRCRIAYWAHQETFDQNPYVAWIRDSIAQFH